jgi:hypothetical protein
MPPHCVLPEAAGLPGAGHVLFCCPRAARTISLESGPRKTKATCRLPTLMAGAPTQLNPVRRQLGGQDSGVHSSHCSVTNRLCEAVQRTGKGPRRGMPDCLCTYIHACTCARAQMARRNRQVTGVGPKSGGGGVSRPLAACCWQNGALGMDGCLGLGDSVRASMQQ